MAAANSALSLHTKNKYTNTTKNCLLFLQARAQMAARLPFKGT